MSSVRKFRRRAPPITQASGRQRRTDYDIDLRLRRGRYFSRIWYLSNPSQPRDMLCLLERELPDGKWRFTYRFRYYEDGEAFDSKDRKNFYAGEFEHEMPEAEVVAKTHEAVTIIADMQGFRIDVTVIESDDPDVVMSKLSEKPFFNMRMDESGVLQ